MSGPPAAHEIFDGRLFLLAARRAASPAMLVWLAALVALALATASEPESARQAAADGALAPEVWLHGLTRRTTIALLGCAWIPLVLARAAAIVPRWRRGEITWLAGRAAGTRTILVSTWAGTFAAVVLQAALALAVLEAALGSGAPSLRAAGTLSSPAESWLAGGRELRWTSDAPEETGAHVRVELGLGLGPGASAEVRLSAQRAGGEARSASARIATRGAIELELPPGTGRLELVLSAPDEDARFFVPPRAVSAWVPCADERLASLVVLARATIALAAWIALALGLGAFVSAPTALALACALSLSAWNAPLAPRAWPGGGLLDALAAVGLGRVPAPGAPEELAAAVLSVLLGLALAALGLRAGGATR